MKNITQNHLRTYKNIRLAILACFTLLLLEMSCGKWDLDTSDFVEVFTSSSIELGSNSLEVIVSGEIKGLSSENSVEQHGHVWSSTIEIPTLVNKDKQTTFLKKGNGTFSSTLDGLAPGAVYYYRAYALDGNQPIYGEVKTFTNSSVTFDAIIESFTNLTEISDKFQIEAKTMISNIEQDIFIADYGIVWGVEPQPAIEEDRFISKSSTTADGTPIIFTELLTDLQSGCNYVRPYLNIGGLVFYGQEECYQFGNVWLEKADFPGQSRAVASVFSIDGKAYFGMGFDLVTYLQDFWEYDPITDNWNQKNNFGGIARRAAVSFSIDGKGYISTGYNGVDVLSDLWEYDPQTDTWTQKANLSGAARLGGVGFSIDGKGYVGIGFNSAFTVLQDFWQYDQQTNSWTQKANFGGVARAAGIGFSIDGKGYIGTGSNDDGETFSDFWEYDPQTDAWTQKADFGGGTRDQAAGFSIDDKGYIGTGLNNAFNYTRDFWEYNPQADAWSQKTDFDGSVGSSGVAFSVGNRGYIMMGSIGLNDVWEYVPEAD